MVSFAWMNMRRSTIVAILGVGAFSLVLVFMLTVSRRGGPALLSNATVTDCVHSGDGTDGSNEFVAGAVAYAPALPDSFAAIMSQGTNVRVSPTFLRDHFQIEYQMMGRRRQSGFSIFKDEKVSEEELLEYFCRIDSNGQRRLDTKRASGEIAAGDWTLTVVGQFIYSGPAPAGNKVKPGFMNQGKADYIKRFAGSAPPAVQQ